MNRDDKKLRVVIVDEDPMFLRVWEKVFRLLDNCNYCLTNDPNMVKMLAKEHKIDLLVSEVVMEHGSGFDLAERVHRQNPHADIILTTAFNCDLRRFDLHHPKFHILYKPYQNIDDVIKFVSDIMRHKDPRKEQDEDSYSENEEFPSVMEWKL